VPDKATSPVNPIAIGSNKNTIWTVRLGFVAGVSPVKPSKGRESLRTRSRPVPRSSSQCGRRRRGQRAWVRSPPGFPWRPRADGVRARKPGHSGRGHLGMGGPQQPLRPQRGWQCRHGLDLYQAFPNYAVTFGYLAVGLTPTRSPTFDLQPA